MYTCSDCKDSECSAKFDDPNGPMCDSFTLEAYDEEGFVEENGVLFDRITNIENEVTQVVEDLLALEERVSRVIAAVVRAAQE